MFRHFTLLVSLATVLLHCWSGVLPAQDKGKLPEAVEYAKVFQVLRSVELHFTPDSRKLMVLRYFGNKREPVLSVHDIGQKGRELSHSLVGTDLFGKAELATERYNNSAAIFRGQGIRVAINPNSLIFLTSSLKTVRLWEITNPAKAISSIKSLIEPLEYGGSVLAAFTKDGKRLLTVNLSGGIKVRDPVHYQVRLLDVDSGRLIGEPSKGIAPVGRGQRFMKSLQWAPDEKTFIMACGIENSEAQFVYFWDARTLQPIGERLAAPGNIHHFSPDGKSILIFSSKGISVWDVERRKQLSNLSGLIWGQGGGGVKPKFVVHPDGFSVLGMKRLDNAHEQVELWKLSADAPMKKQVLKHTDFVYRFAMSQDGKLAATEASSTTDGVRIWNLETGKPILRIPLTGRDGLLRALEFSPDGRFLATVTDRDLQIWSLNVKK